MTTHPQVSQTTKNNEDMPLADIVKTLSSLLHLDGKGIERTIVLLDEGNTIPFIARYRKEVTGSLDEVQIQSIADKTATLRTLFTRKLDVQRLIAAQGKLNDELASAIKDAQTLQEVEDIYLPYRPKRKTRASVAREKGLEPLALIILRQPESSQDAQFVLQEEARPFLNAAKGVDTEQEAYAGACDIVAEIIAEDADVRGTVRALFTHRSVLSAKGPDEEERAQKDPNGIYRLYYDFHEEVAKLVPHRVLALNRAEREGVVRVAVVLPFEQVQREIGQHYPLKATSPFAPLLAEAMEDSYKRLLGPAMEREVRTALTHTAEEHAIAIFATNLRHLLLQPPVRNKKVLGIDPGFRTGCKLAVIDETGKYLFSDTMYLHQSAKASALLRQIIADYAITVIAIGNGTASRETEQLVADLLSQLKQEGVSGEIGYVLVNEAGASVYSASEAAREEFPTLDATQRGTISIARRLQDPLAELVKIEPKAIGVGLYQHDVDQKSLAEALERVVVSCVNFAGVDLNSASVALLKHVSGINTRVANALVKYRESKGRFTTRQELQKVPGLGPTTFVQAAGFLKIAHGTELLDNTFIHPESYTATRKFLHLLPPSDNEHASLADRIALFRQQLRLQARLSGLQRNNQNQRRAHQSVSTGLEEVAQQIEIGLPTLQDMLENLEKPGLDPRDALPPPLLRQDVLKLEDLQPGMVLRGTVRNVVDFGAFVDIGVKQDGLVHVSELTDRFVRDPLSVVSVGQVVQVRVLKVDQQRGRVQLSMRGLSGAEG